MDTFDLDQDAGEHFTFRKPIECGETWLETQGEGRHVANFPLQDSSRLAMLQLATTVLDPIWNHYGPVTITYGFCSPELARLRVWRQKSKAFRNRRLKEKQLKNISS